MNRAPRDWGYGWHINVLTSDAIVALPGDAGTASEVELAISYGRPIIAFVESAEEIAWLPEGVPRTDDFEEVCSFVRHAVGL